MFGAIIAYHDTSLFMSSTMWIIVAVIGLLLFVVFAAVINLPHSRLTNCLTCTAVFILLIGSVMTVITFLVTNHLHVGIICAFFVALFSLLARVLYSLANDGDERDKMEEYSLGEVNPVVEMYANDDPGS
jgi:FtsH-binding integral membrane protein